MKYFNLYKFTLIIPANNKIQHFTNDRMPFKYFVAYQHFHMKQNKYAF